MLRRVYTDISERIDAQSVARSMFQSNALTLKELQSVQSKHGKPVKAAEQLLNIVMNQSANAYCCFLSVLKTTDHEHVFHIIVSRSYKGTYDTCRLSYCGTRVRRRVRFFWPRNVLKRSICHRNVCRPFVRLSVRLSVCLFVTFVYHA